MATKLSCHLESSDSVRTSPGSEAFEQHSNRFFSEAFSRLLFGEQIRSAQIPVLDSYGAVQFFSELVDSLRRKSEDFGSSVVTATPVVMCHYPSLGKGHRWDTQNPDYRRDVYAETFASRLRMLDYKLSALPEFADTKLREILADWFCAEAQNESETELPVGVHDALLPSSRAHVRRMSIIAKYFRRHHRAAVQPNVGEHIPLMNCFRVAIQQGLTPEVPELSPVIRFFRQVVAENPQDFIRSKTYARIESELAGDNILLAKELTNSFYMWDLARCADAGVEVTSSGIETKNDDLETLGEVVNQWADRTKCRIVGQREEAISIRPILQRGSFYGVDSLSNAEFRRQLTDGLAELLLTTDIMERRVHLMQKESTDKGLIHDYWQAMAGMIRSFQPLRDLVGVHVNEHGVLVCSFHSPDQRPHQVATIVDDVFVSPDAVDMTREALQAQVDVSDRDGNLMDI